MKIRRREFVTGAALGAAATAAAAGRASEDAKGLPVRVGMTDWNLGQRGDISKISLAREIGLDGIQISLIFPEDGSLHLRDPAVQARFRQAALDNGVQICSLAIGGVGKSRMPLHTNPAAAILLIEAIEVARGLGTNDILLPVLGRSHIHMENQAEVDTFVAMMKEVSRFAEKAGIVVSLEDWLSASDNMRILDAIGSDNVAVYYDPRNMKAKVGDPYGDATLLGQRIHQIHVKNGKKLMRELEELDWPRLAQEFYDVGYKGWYVLETRSPSGDLIKDTRDNVDYVRKTFRIPS
jgi:sugar phosphate isomerase/epimerase